MEVITRLLKAAGYAATWMVWNCGGKHIYRLLIRPIVQGCRQAVAESMRSDALDGITGSLDQFEVKRALSLALYNHVRIYGVAR